MVSGSVRYGQAAADDIVSTIVTAVADENGVDPGDLAPLYDTIDPDGLITFVSTAGASANTNFTYCGRKVTVRGDGSVEIRRPPDDE